MSTSQLLHSLASLPLDDSSKTAASQGAWDKTSVTQVITELLGSAKHSTEHLTIWAHLIPAAMLGAGAVNAPSSQARNPMLREVKRSAQGHTERNWWD